MPKAQTLSFAYQVIRKPHIEHLYLRIRDGKVLVTANIRVSEDRIEAFVKSKQAWIQKHLSNAVQKCDLTQKDAEIYLLGKAYPLRLHSDASHIKGFMRLEDDTASFHLPHTATHETLLSLRDAYYRQLCPETITPLVEKHSKAMRCSPTRISYRHNRSRWGSCSSQNRLSFNTRLMMLPESMITYVIIHELAHITHKNHAAAFWQLVEKHCPDYKTLRRGMRDFESLL